MPGTRHPRYLILIALLLALLTIFYRFNTMGGTLGGFENDEFQHVSRAQQMLRGDLPIRDFVEPGMPLMDVLSAAARAIAGPTLFAESALTIGMLALSTALLFLFAARASGSIAISAIVAVLQILMAPRFYNYPKMFVYALAIAATWGYLARPSQSRLFVMAVVGVVAFLFRHDHGAYIGTTAIVTVIVAHWPNPRVIIRNVAVLGAMAFVLVAPYLVYAQVNGGAMAYFRTGLAFAARDAGRTNLVLPAFAFDLSQPLIRRDPARVTLPTVNVRWTDASDAIRLDRERAHGLVVFERLSRDVWKYSLTDASRTSLEALVRDPQVADTEGIDRTTFALPAPEPPTERERLSAAAGRLHILPGILQSANAIPFLYYLLALIPLAALVTVVAMKGPAKIGVVTFLALLMVLGLLRGNLASRLADVSEVVGVLAAWLAAVSIARRTRPARAAAIVAAFLIVVLTASSINALEGFSTGIWQTGIDEGPRGIGQRAREVYDQQTARPPADAWDPSVTGTVRLAQYVEACTAPSDRLFVLGYAPELYVFSGRGFAGGLSAVLPGFYVSDEAQRQIIARLALTRVPIVVTALEREYDDDYKPDFPLVDAFFREHYVEAGVADLGNGVRYRILADRSVTPTRTYAPLQLPCFQ